MTRPAPQPAQEAREREMHARITEAVRYHRCYRCMHAPCTCPPGEGLGVVLADGAALEPGKPRRLRQDEEQVVPGSYVVPKKRRGKGGSR